MALRSKPLISLLGVLLLAADSVALPGFGGEEPQLREFHAEVAFRVRIPNPIGSKYLSLWVPYPISDDDQQIENIKSEGDYQSQGVYREPEFGNMVLYLRWLQEEGDAELDFSFEVKRREQRVLDFSAATDTPAPALVAPFLKQDPALTLTLADALQALSVSGRSPLDRARAVYDYIIEHFERDPKIVGCGTGNVARFLDARKGKCADFSSTFVALARAALVPAREVYGLRLSAEPRADISDDYHCWAEFYLSGIGWVPVDPSDVVKFAQSQALPLDDPAVNERREYYFGSVDERRLRLGTGSEIRLAPVQLLKPLAYFMCPYLEVGYESSCEGADLKKSNLRGLTFSASCYPLLERHSLIGVGEEAPAFAGRTLAGEVLRSDALGQDWRYTVLSFFATW